MGDTNIFDSREEPNIVNILEKQGFADIWKTLYPQHAGYTWDGVENTMVNDGQKDRLDRCLLKSLSWIAKGMAVIGRERVLASTIPATTHVFPSDHFGLFMQLVKQ